MSTTPPNDRGQLGPAYNQACRQAAAAYIDGGTIPPALRADLQALATAYQASQAIGTVARLGRIAEALEAELIEDDAA